MLSRFLFYNVIVLKSLRKELPDNQMRIPMKNCKNEKSRKIVILLVKILELLKNSNFNTNIAISRKKSLII